MSKLTYQQRDNQNTRIPVGQRRTASGKVLEDNRTVFAAKQLKQGETAQLTKEEDELLKGKSGTKQLAKKDEEEIDQAKFSDRGPPVQREEQPAKPNNTGLPDNLKNGIESLSGLSMDNVKVHYNSAKPQQLNALAYAQGTDIHVSPGQEQHLPHEAWHVVQQAQGRVKPTMQMKGGVPVNDDKRLEHKADVMGERGVHKIPANSPHAQQTPQLQALADSHSKVMQRKVAYEEAETRNRYARAKNNEIKSSIYLNQYAQVDELSKPVKVFETTDKSQGEGDYAFNHAYGGGIIRIHPLVGDANPSNVHFNDNISTLGHEFQHALDHLGRDKVEAFELPKGDIKRWNIIHTEWRAWAIQAAINFEYSGGVVDESTKIHDHQKFMLQTYLKPDDRTKDGNHFLRKTHIYINEHVFHDVPTSAYTIEQTKSWMLNDHQAQAWWEESLQIFKTKTAMEEVMGEVGTGPIQITNVEVMDSIAPGMKTAGGLVKKIRKEGEFRVMEFNGKQYILPKTLMEYFDSASGEWAPEATSGPISIDSEQELDIKVPGMKIAGSLVKKIRKEGEFRVMEFNGKQYILPKTLMEYFDSASGEWA